MVEVILVDANDKAIGTMEKIEVHEKGLLHRAVTVYIINSQGELLLQRRAKEKYHCGGLWSNTCCGHPYPQELTQEAAKRRLKEEMGMESDLSPVLEICYELPLSNGLIEHEYGHIFFGVSDAKPVPDLQEAEEWRYVSLEELKYEMQHYPENFTPWFLLTLPRLYSELNNFHSQGWV